MNGIWKSLRFHWLYFCWRRRAHRRRRPKLAVGNLSAFFRELNERGVTYVVLRWFDELPLDEATERRYDGDMDLMVDSRCFHEFCRVVAAHPGRIKIDLYSEGVQMGTGYVRLPYYPPPKALEMLTHRTLYKNAFYVPAPQIYLYSLCYHLTYHKGLLSGLDTGLDGARNPVVNRHSVVEELRRLAERVGETLPEPITLFSLHQWLRERYWDMPYDLLARWGKPDEWHRLLQRHLEHVLQEQLGGLHDIIVFMIREDAVQQKADDVIMEKLRAKFVVLDKVKLEGEAVRRVMNETRGADWTKHKSTLMIPPVYAVVCHDPAPVPVPPDSKLGKIHFNVHNNNVFYKHELRDWLEERYPGASGNFLHVSDNDLESMAYLLAVYGKDQMDAARERLLAAIGN
jgi:hypothetical protein